MQRILKASLLYLVLGAFIVGWWTVAFRPTEISAPSPLSFNSQTLALKTSQLLEELSPLQRDALQSALSGHFPLMVEMIEQWDL